MEHGAIVEFLEGRCSPENFAAEIAQEVTRCVKGLARGGLGHIIVTRGLPTILTRDHAVRLLQAITDERISFDAANYLADGLIMSEDFDFADTKVEEAIDFVADDSVLPTIAEVRQALNHLV